MKSAFRDKNDGRIYLVGETFSADEGRVAELAQGGFVEEPAKPKRAPRKKAPAKE